MQRCCRRFPPPVFITLAWPVAALLAVLAGCAGDGTRWNPEDYTVKSGDTVYSIAWRYELDPEAFAAWNHLGPGKLIRPGQRLHTRPPAGYREGDEQARALAYAPADTRRTTLPAASGRDTSEIPAGTPWVRAEKGDTLYSLSRRSGVSVQRLAQLNQLEEPYVIRPGQTIFLQPLKAGGNKPASATGQVAGGGNKAAVSWPKSIRWQRPARGKVVKRFNRRKSDARGIDIAGRAGDAIVAAADGKVVYSGNGLISYGNLVIIKHNRHYLSAYAYNRKLLVKEGDRVKAGQKIAEMGSKDAHKPLLHFEIRKNGKPVDPLKYLPW